MKGIFKITRTKEGTEPKSKDKINIVFNKGKGVYLKSIFKLTGERISPWVSPKVHKE